MFGKRKDKYLQEIPDLQLEIFIFHPYHEKISQDCQVNGNQISSNSSRHTSIIENASDYFFAKEFIISADVYIYIYIYIYFFFFF